MQTQKLEEFDELLEAEGICTLDSSLAKHKMSIRPQNKRKPASPSPTPPKRQGSIRRDRSSSFKKQGKHSNFEDAALSVE